MGRGSMQVETAESGWALPTRYGPEISSNSQQLAAPGTVTSQVPAQTTESVSAF